MDDKFIHKVLAGDTEAFRYIISKYKDMAYSIAMSILKDEFYAEEILQISFINAYDNLNTFKGASKFSTWFYRIVINESFKHLKKQKNALVNFVETPPDNFTCIDYSILQLEEDLQKYIINEALKRLSPNESLALRLFYLEENSIDDIQEMTGWSVSNTKVIIHRARINMKYIVTEIYKLDKKVLY